MTAFQQALVDWAVNIANDNRYTYARYPNNTGPWTFDCATFNSLTIYKAMGWDWDSEWSTRGYFWPDPNEEQYGAYDFLYNNGWTKYNYSDNLLTEGAIIICNPGDGWHSFMYIGNGELVDANPNYSSNNQIAVRSFPLYGGMYLIFLPPNVTPGPGPGPGPITRRYCPKTFIRRRF